MRIISGAQKGRRISHGKSARIRPTSDKAKECIFNVLREEVSGKRVLDIFAGAGGLGLEALSRGAQSVTFVDASLQSISVLKKNLETLHLKDKSTVLKIDGLRAIKKLSQSYDLIFADPPYGKGYAQQIVDALIISGVLEENGILVLEHHKKEVLSSPQEKLPILKQKRFGDTVISFFLKKS